MLGEPTLLLGPEPRWEDYSASQAS